MLRFRYLIQGSVFAGAAAYGYAQTVSVYLLLAAVWLAGFVAWNLFEAILQILGNGNGQIERYVAIHHLSTPVIGVSAGTFSIVAISTIDSHWFLLVHGIFWIGLGTLLLAFIFFMAGISKALLPENRDAYFQKVPLPGFESLGIQVRNMVNER